MHEHFTLATLFDPLSYQRMEKIERWLEKTNLSWFDLPDTAVNWPATLVDRRLLRWTRIYVRRFHSGRLNDRSARTIPRPMLYQGSMVHRPKHCPRPAVVVVELLFDTEMSHQPQRSAAFSAHLPHRTSSNLIFDRTNIDRLARCLRRHWDRNVRDQRGRRNTMLDPGENHWIAFRRAERSLSYRLGSV